MHYKLGKTPARKGAVKFKLSVYGKKLPTPPKKAGHLGIFTAQWGMLGNDQYGDCVWAGAAHETMLWNKEAQKDVAFVDESVLSDYAACTGFNPNDPSTDNGTDMQVAASYRQKTGIEDSQGNRHKIGAYLEVSTIKQIKQAIWIFGAAGIGIKFPNSAMDQFNVGKPWTVQPGSTIEGGHYIPAVNYDEKFLYVVTWGKVQKAAWSFIKKYMDEGIVYLSQEMLNDGKTLDGFDLATLQADLAAL